MGRLSAIFVALCIVLIACSIGTVLYLRFGLSGTESAIVGLTALVLLEKLSPPGRILPVLVGCVLSAAGAWLLAAAGLIPVFG